MRLNKFCHHVDGIRMLNCAWRMDIHAAIVEDNNIKEFKGNCDDGRDSNSNISNSELEGEGT
jgi:hypothetical protein